MKLSELAPRWVTVRDSGARVGMTFLCPHCLQCRLSVYFSEPYYDLVHPPTEWELFMAQHPENEYWKRSGDDFATMTLTPSVNTEKHGHWHGSITNGETS